MMARVVTLVGSRGGVRGGAGCGSWRCFMAACRGGASWRCLVVSGSAVWWIVAAALCGGEEPSKHEAMRGNERAQTTRDLAPSSSGPAAEWARPCRV
jgi:hypothetical protein